MTDLNVPSNFSVECSLSLVSVTVVFLAFQRGLLHLGEDEQRTMRRDAPADVRNAEMIHLNPPPLQTAASVKRRGHAGGIHVSANADTDSSTAAEENPWPFTEHERS